MTDFRKGFFLASRKQEPEMQEKYEETKKLQKKTHDAITSSSGGETQKTGEIYFKPGGLGSQLFWSDEHGLAHQNFTKPLERGQKTPQIKYQADRNHKQWTSRYFMFENGQLKEGIDAL